MAVIGKKVVETRTIKPVATSTPKVVGKVEKETKVVTPIVAQVKPVAQVAAKPVIASMANAIQAASPTGAGVLSATSAASPAIQTKDLRLEQPEVDPVEGTYDEVEDKYIEDVEATASNKRRRLILIGIAVAVVLVVVVVLIKRRKK